MNEDNENFIKIMKEATDNISKEEARAFLVKAGIYDENGRLTEPYLVKPEHLLGSKGPQSIKEVKGLLKILVGKTEARATDARVLNKLRKGDIYEKYSYGCPEHLAYEMEHYNLLRKEVIDAFDKKGFGKYFKIR